MANITQIEKMNIPIRNFKTAKELKEKLLLLRNNIPETRKEFIQYMNDNFQYRGRPTNLCHAAKYNCKQCVFRMLSQENDIVNKDGFLCETTNNQKFYFAFKRLFKNQGHSSYNKLNIQIAIDIITEKIATFEKTICPRCKTNKFVYFQYTTYICKRKYLNSSGNEDTCWHHFDVGRIGRPKQ